MSYQSPCLLENPCYECKYHDYDSFHDEHWCVHDPLPEGTFGKGQVDPNGSCEHFKSWDSAEE